MSLRQACKTFSLSTSSFRYQAKKKPFECYADDVVVPCKTEMQDKFVLRSIKHRLRTCKLTLHPNKTKIVNLRGRAMVRYPKKYHFLGFANKPCLRKIQGKATVMPGTFASSEGNLAKVRKPNIHKLRKPLEEVAAALNPMIRRLLNYFHASWDGLIRCVWKQLNHLLLKWAK